MEVPLRVSVFGCPGYPRGVWAAIGAALLVGVLAGDAAAQTEPRLWRAVGGETTITLNVAVMERLGIRLQAIEETATPIYTLPLSLAFAVDPTTVFSFTEVNGQLGEFLDATLAHRGGVVMRAAGRLWELNDFVFESTGTGEETRFVVRDRRRASFVPFALAAVKTGFSSRDGTLAIRAAHLQITPAFAEALGSGEIAGRSVGLVVVVVRAEPVTGGVLDAPAASAAPPRQRTAGGGDITFCELFALHQYGREGDVAALSVATNMWNIGDQPMNWYANPDSRHPFIVMNMFRIKDDRIEQIGQSWIKHGFFALTDSDCGSGCIPPPVYGKQLGVQCTDTYGSSLNAVQSIFGPREEANPWTGAYAYAGSHIDTTGTTHDQIEHRLQVHDADLDPAQNPGAEYFIDAYYAHADDIDPLNSLAWKPTTVSGTPGGTWTFGVTDRSVPPNIGPTIDAWGGTQTIVAAEVPVVQFQSPDGRCILSTKTTDLGGGTWRYEYALYNHDMDRQVRSFTVPVAAGASVSNTYSHAVESHDEPFTNDPWSVTVGPTSITWATGPYALHPTTNPLRWNTLYNFGFQATAPPVPAPLVFGLYKPGIPTLITAVASAAGQSDCNSNGIDDVLELAAGSSSDCNSNKFPDDCESDCNTNGVADDCDVSAGTSQDCDGNVIPDECELVVDDCNSNGVVDVCDITSGTSNDCDGDKVPDECQLIGNDCDGDQVPDQCEPDCNTNSIPDQCDITGGTAQDCNSNSVPDRCDIDQGGTLDCNTNRVPDECELLGNDCNSNTVPDECEPDCNTNSVPDDCDIIAGSAVDCNTNAVPDLCDLATGTSVDCDTNVVPDECQIAAGTSADCNANDVPDECDIGGATSIDDLPVGGNGIPDECEADCNSNGIPDLDDIVFGTANDCNSNAVPDLCEATADCNTNGVLDLCELYNGTESDCNNNGVLDSCESVVPGDGDGDTDIDLCDFAVFQWCYGQPAAVCGCMDLDASGTVDGPDVPLFVAIMTGPFP